MMQNLSVIVLSAQVGWRQFRYLIKKEITRLKLKRRGSFAGSTWVSLMFRPILEKDRVKAYLSTPLFAAAIMVGVAQLPNTDAAWETWSVEKPIEAVLGYEVKLPQAGDTITYLLPVADLTGVSQGFHEGHPGVDLRSPAGHAVVAMERGTVVDIEKDTFGYGRHVYIRHMYDITSMYAHLDKIVVRMGQEVEPDQIIGTVGLTGWTTGPHLHFEVYEGTERVNPMKYIGPTVEMARQAVLIRN